MCHPERLRRELAPEEESKDLLLLLFRAADHPDILE